MHRHKLDSVQTPIAERRRIWGRIASDLRRSTVESAVSEIALDDVPEVANGLLNGSHRGRTIVRVAASER